MPYVRRPIQIEARWSVHFTLGSADFFHYVISFDTESAFSSEPVQRSGTHTLLAALS